MGKRIEYIDVVSGIMISWMIIGHCIHFSHFDLPCRYLLSFYMPWFFYKSGMLYKPKNIIDLFQKDSSKYLRYFVVYSFIGWMVWSVCSIINGQLTIRNCLLSPILLFVRHGNISGNGALWFLLSLFLVRQIGNFIVNSFKGKNVLLIFSFLCFAVAFFLYTYGWYNHSWWFGNLFSGLCFFLLGYWLKDKEQNRQLFLVSTVFYILVVVAAFSGIIDGFPNLYMHANKMTSGSYWLFYPMALAGIIMTNNLFRIFCKTTRFRVLEYIGHNSMNFYITHWILFVLVTFIAKNVFHVDSPAMLFVVLLCSSIIFLPLISWFIDSLKAHNSILEKVL